MVDENGGMERGRVGDGKGESRGWIGGGWGWNEGDGVLLGGRLNSSCRARAQGDRQASSIVVT